MVDRVAVRHRLLVGLLLLGGGRHAPLRWVVAAAGGGVSDRNGGLSRHSLGDRGGRHRAGSRQVESLAVSSGLGCGHRAAALPALRFHLERCRLGLHRVAVVHAVTAGMGGYRAQLEPGGGCRRCVGCRTIRQPQCRRVGRRDRRGGARGSRSRLAAACARRPGCDGGGGPTGDDSRGEMGPLDGA